MEETLQTLFELKMFVLPRLIRMYYWPPQNWPRDALASLSSAAPLLSDAVEKTFGFVLREHFRADRVRIKQHSWSCELCYLYGGEPFYSGGLTVCVKSPAADDTADDFTLLKSPSKVRWTVTIGKEQFVETDRSMGDGFGDYLTRTQYITF